MSQRLKDRSAVVTGGGSGLGESTALAFGREGASVAILDISMERAQRTVDLVRASGATAIAVACDVTDAHQVARAFDEAAAAHGVVDVVFNNAGVTGPIGYVSEISPADFDSCIAINLRGMFLVAREFLRRATEAHVPASMVSTASINATFAEPMGAVYASTKGAVVAMTRAMALDHAREGIRVNCVCPGHVLTAMTQVFYDKTPGALEYANAMHAMGRIGRPEEIAAAVVFLSSNEASFITGAALNIDGGLSLGAAIVPNYDVGD